MARANKAKVASLTVERAELRARIQSLTDDVLGYKSDLKHTLTARARDEDREKKVVKGLRFAEDEMRVVSFRLLGKNYVPKQRRWIGPTERLLKLRAPCSAWPRSATRYEGASRDGRL